jgi:methylmalonyl-CoA/ethylmalonyl-CoA epimerase
MAEQTATGGGVHLKEVAQVALTVSDLARAKAFYGETLGMKFLFDAGTMAFFQCGAVRVMLGLAEQPVTPAGTILYYKVGDLQGVRAALAEKAVPFLQPPHLVAKMPGHDLWMAFLKDPDGNVLGLMSEVACSS